MLTIETTILNQQ